MLEEAKGCVIEARVLWNAVKLYLIVGEAVPDEIEGMIDSRLAVAERTLRKLTTTVPF